MNEVGSKFLYNEDGFKCKVTLEKREKNQRDAGQSDWHDYAFKIDEIISYGPFKPEMSPSVGDTMHVGYAEGYEHYAGWSIREVKDGQ